MIAQLDELGAFEKIYKAVEASIEAHKDISGSDIASMYGGLVQFAEAVYPDRLVYVDNILEQAVKVIDFTILKSLFLLLFLSLLWQKTYDDVHHFLTTYIVCSGFGVKGTIS